MSGTLNTGLPQRLYTNEIGMMTHVANSLQRELADSLAKEIVVSDSETLHIHQYECDHWGAVRQTYDLIFDVVKKSKHSFKIDTSRQQNNIITVKLT